MREYFCQKSKYAELTRLAVPLILASSGTTVMQFVDGVFLARHSDLEIAAAGCAGMLCWLLCSLFVGTVNYTSAMVSNLLGAQKLERIGLAVWQGIYFSILGGAVTALVSLPCPAIFRAFGHAPELVAYETTYARILLGCSCFHLAQLAVAGFFSGRGDNTRLMLAEVSGQLFNILGDYVLVFGKFGFPEWGLAGAALATVGGSLLTFVILMAMMLTPRNRRTYATLRNWHLEVPLLRRLCAFGVPSGATNFVDAVIWTLFMMLMGSLGALELAATTICFRMNAIALLPTFGIGHAETALVGRSHGAGDDREAMRYTGHGAVLCFLWMISIASTFVLCPEFYFRLFIGEGSADGPQLLALGRVFIRFVAIYCSVDSLNVSLVVALGAVGDTRYTFKVMGGCSLAFCAALFLAVTFFHAAVTTAWTLVTIYVVVLPIFWGWRLHSGRWRGRVVG